MNNGWNESASAWIKDMGELGDRGRQHILDPAMHTLLNGRHFNRMLDIGCGEGRLCRILKPYFNEAIGIDPTIALIENAQEKDPNGKYIVGNAEELPFDNEGFDLVISCLSLIDIPDFEKAIDEMARVLAPNGTLLIANSTSFNTAGSIHGWQLDENGERLFYGIDDYMKHFEVWESWRGITIKNHHRPLSDYMKAFLSNNLVLKHFDEPLPVSGDENWVSKYGRMPWYLLMEWQK